MNFVLQGIGAIPTYTIFVATKLQHCNYVNNSNQGCVQICINYLLWTSEETDHSTHPCTSRLKPGVSCC